MKRLKPIISVLLVSIFIFSALATPLSASAEEDSNIKEDKPVTIKAYDSASGNHSAKQISNVFGIRLNLGAPFNKVNINIPTWSTNDSSATIAVYKWNTDYSTTMASTPIKSQRFENLSDNASNKLEFDEQPAGEYLICVMDPKGSIGVWQLPKTVGNGFVYEDGLESEADWEMSVGFTKTPINPFLEVKSVNTVDGNHKSPDEYVIPEDSLLYTHKVMPDTWVFTDGLGRKSLTYDDVGGIKEDKTSALFYWTWHADLGNNEPLNITQFMLKYPEAKNDYNFSEWPKSNTAYFWNEPIYGYYKTDDEWVLRRQAEMLANAGIDVIFTDNTNGNYTWRTSYTKLYETWDNAQKNGAVNVPKVSYMLPFGPTDGSKEQLINIYLDIYRPGKYQNLWYYLDGKPMMMAHNSNIGTSVNVEKEIKSFFTWRPGQPSYLVDKTSYATWGWLSTYPQALYYKNAKDMKNEKLEQMTVGVAVNHNYVTHQITAMNGENVIGRSYTSTGYHTEEGASLWGYNFSEQMEYALEKNPKILFVTGWNEWTAGRHESWSNIDNAFPDQYIDEYSRDIEPTKGELKDHYYYLLVNSMRRYKGCNPIPEPTLQKTIDINGDMSQWSDVGPYFASYIGNTENRDAKGYGSLVYTETSGRNDIIGAQVARDDENVYFNIECAENITPYTDKLWMTLYIDSDQENQGWETFDYVVNKSAASASTAVLEKFTGDGYNAKKVADVEYKVNGRYMVIKISKDSLGLEGNDYTINFSCTDNVHDEGNYDVFSGDIMDFYISGDVAPGARFKYSFISTQNNSVETLPETDPPETESTPVTETESSQTETTGDETSKTDEKEGCKSSFGGMSVILLAAVSGTAMLVKKKKAD